LYIASITKIKGIGHQHLWEQQNSFVGIHRDHHGYLDPIDDHLPERGLDNVWSIPEPYGNSIKGAMTLRCFWNCQCVDMRKQEKFHGDPKVVRRVPNGVLELRGSK
jgi:hypothetical protein